MTLSENERRVLAAIHMQAMAPLAAIRKESRLPDHTIRYALAKLKDKGLIHFSPVINVYRLGLAHYGVFLALASAGKEMHARFVNSLVESEQVSFLCEVGGDYQYGMSICAPGLLQVSEFLDRLSRRFGDIIFEKAIAVRLALADFPIKHLLGKNADSTPMAWGVSREFASIDAVDHQILRALSIVGMPSKTRISAEAKLPLSTLEYRLKKLEKGGIIVGYRYLLDTMKLGVLSYFLLVQLKGIDSSFKGEFRRFCAQHVNVRFLVENLGAWDYEVGVEVHKPREVVTLIQEIHDRFRNKIAGIRSLPVFSYAKVQNYPFKNYDSLAEGLHVPRR